MTTLPSSRDPYADADRAVACERASLDLRRAGRRAEAAAEATRATAVWREVLRTLPRLEVLPFLARSLSNGSILLGEANRPHEALNAAEEALALRRELTAHDRKASLRDLGESLLNVSLGLAEHKRHLEALEAAAESVAAFSDLAAHDRQAHLKRLADCTYNLAMRLGDLGRRGDALLQAQEALSLRRELTQHDREAFLPDLAAGLEHVGNRAADLGQFDAASHALKEALDLLRELAVRRGATFTPAVARCHANLAKHLSDAGRPGEALEHADQAAQMYRKLQSHQPLDYSSELAGSLSKVAAALVGLGRCREALGPMSEATELYRAITTIDRASFLPGLAGSLDDMAVVHMLLGNRALALNVSLEGLQLNRELVSTEGEGKLPDLARSLANASAMLGDVGRVTEAIETAGEAAAIYWRLERANPGAHRVELARGLHNVARGLAFAGDYQGALKAIEDAVELRRGLVLMHRAAFLADLAMSLDSLGKILGNLGRQQAAQVACEESVRLYRELAAANEGSFAGNLAVSLSGLGACLARLGRYEDALQATDDAIGTFRRAAAATVRDHSAELRMCLRNKAEYLGRVGRRSDALDVAQESVELCRRLVSLDRASTSDLAGTLDNLAFRLADLGRHAEALEATQEAIDLYRDLVARDLEAHPLDRAIGLRSLGLRLSAVGLRDEARNAFRECAALALELHPYNPPLWTAMCRVLAQELDSARDLRIWLLPLLRLLTEHRELAWSSEHAGIFLDLQALVASRTWDLLANLPADDGDLLDETVAALVAALHSPDLGRWLEARCGGDGPLAKLAELKREVIEAEQLLTALRKGLPGGDRSGWRADSPGPGAEAQRDALINDIERQSARAQALRQAFRDERARLVAEDPRFAAAFQTFDSQALRSLAGHAQGGALLCVLELGIDGEHSDRDQPFSAERGRAVAALLHADSSRTQLLELGGVHELAWHAQSYRPESLGGSRRGPLRGAPAGATRSVSDGACPPPITDLLAPRMSESFWAPLQQALRASGVAVERLHVCLHGTTQQLPLALRQDSDCPGLQVIPWPGMPYLRRAAMAASAKAESHTGADASAPWLVGHDCAWGSEQPLPMVAVEAALLRDLLQRHGQPVQPIRLGAQVRRRASALVACCHGGAEQAQFDHALHLGQEPLTVRQIVQENLGPPLALLPACHAGRTDEDAAGNALGVAAAFMLSGTKVVVASSKAVPDLLQPWLSTLTVWHAMQGLRHHEAASLAREQFARLDFPDDYRSWLQQALPQALATIQPGGEEDEHIRGVHAQTALEQVERRWPWEGETKDLFSADRRRREEATRSVVRGILVPRGGEAGARALAAEAREMAAFVFVYGVDSTPGCVRHEPDQDAGRAAAERMN